MFSFTKRKKVVDAVPKIRFLIDSTSPNLPTVNDGRANRRYNRCLPLIICDWNNPERAITLDNVGFGFTSDISDTGFAVLSTFCPKVRDNVIALFAPDSDRQELWFFHVRFAGFRYEPQSFKRMGFNVIQFLNEDHRELTYELSEKAIEMLAVTDPQAVS